MTTPDSPIQPDKSIPSWGEHNLHQRIKKRQAIQPEHTEDTADKQFETMVSQLIDWHVLIPKSAHDKLLTDIMKHVPTLQARSRQAVIAAVRERLPHKYGVEEWNEAIDAVNHLLDEIMEEGK